MSLRFRSSILALALVALIPALAHADTFNFNATLNASNGPGQPLGAMNGTASGTVDYNPATQMFSNANFTASYNGTNYTFSYINFQETYDTVHYAYFLADSTGTGNVFFQIAVPQGFTSGETCSGSDHAGCIDTIDGAPYYYNTSLDSFSGFASDGTPNFSARLGVASEASLTATPEPSSIAMLGTGLVGIAGVVRRRFRA